MDHQIAACRDPIRCRSCGRQGHRSRQCSAPPLPVSKSHSPPPSLSALPALSPALVAAAPTAIPSVSLRHRASPHSSACSRLSLPLPPPPPHDLPPPAPLPTLTTSSTPPPDPSPVSAPSESAGSGSLGGPCRQGSLDVFLPPGRHAAAAVFAFASLTSQSAIQAPTPFIWEAIRAALPDINLEVLPYSLGSLLVRFQSAGECAAAVGRSPLLHKDAVITLVPHDGFSSKRRVGVQAALSVLGFPLAYWHEDLLRLAFLSFGSVVEVDWRCTSGYDYSSVRVVVQVDDVSRIPAELRLRDASTGDCYICQLQLITSWPIPDACAPLETPRPFFVLPTSQPLVTPPAYHVAQPCLLPLSAYPSAHQAHSRPHHCLSVSTLTTTPHVSILARLASMIPAATLLQPCRAPLPRLPALPIIIKLCHLPMLAVADPLAAALPPLPDMAAAQNSPVAECKSPIPMSSLEPDPIHEASARKIRVRAKRSADHAAKYKGAGQLLASRHSERLRAKEPAHYVDMSTKASRLKSVKDELANCSKELKVQVKRRGLLRNRTLNAADLRALAGTVALSATATAELEQVLGHYA